MVGEGWGDNQPQRSSCRPAHVVHLYYMMVITIYIMLAMLAQAIEEALPVLAVVIHQAVGQNVINFQNSTASVPSSRSHKYSIHSLTRGICNTTRHKSIPFFIKRSKHLFQPHRRFRIKRRIEIGHHRR